MNTHYDVLIIGAGLSGIGMACHLSQQLPNKTFAVLERRKDVGGTWDLFKYPGIRSDSDMYTFGFRFRPWMESKVLADGPAIKKYVSETAKEYNVYDKIQFGIHITKSSWNSDSKLWTVVATTESGEEKIYTCQFLVSCTGYYNYDTGHMPNYPGQDQFKGQLIHPQHWPEDLDYSGKKVVVIGSGATAVTLVPAMAGTAQKVTMLQRSPTYVISVPSKDKTAEKLSKYLPEKVAFEVVRRRNIAIQYAMYHGAKRFPKQFRKFLLGRVERQVGKEHMHHFTPDYDPWDQRLCAVPSGDLFKAIRRGEAAVETDHIESFTENGIKLKSGKELEADIIVSATGLELHMLGGIDIEVDGQTREQNQALTYKAVMVQNAPNFAYMFGYTNAPWTLKADLAAQYVCRLIAHMDKKGYQIAVPRENGQNLIESESVMDALNSGYVKRGANALPRQGKANPWRVLNNYKKDKKLLLKDQIEDRWLELS